MAGWVTPLGQVSLAGALLSWAAGVALGWRELLIFGGACLLAVLLAFLFSLGRANLGVRLELDRVRVVAGQQAVGRLSVVNQASGRMLPLRMEAPVGSGAIAVAVPSLDAGEAFEEVFVIPAPRRSVVTLGPVRSVRGDPLELVRREVTWDEAQTLYVHPRTERFSGFARGLVRDLEGRATNDISASDVAFHALRDYVTGDDRRHVHWRTSARLGKLMVRQFVDTRRSTLGLVLATDLGEYADPDEFELAVSVVGSLGISALAEEQQVLCLAGAQSVPAFAPQPLLDGLAGVDSSDETGSAGETVRRSVRAMGGASAIALVTGSRLPVDDLRRIAARFGGQVGVLALRCAPKGAAPTLRSSGPVTVAEIRDLEDLGRQVLAAVA